MTVSESVAEPKKWALPDVAMADVAMGVALVLQADSLAMSVSRWDSDLA